VTAIMSLALPPLLTVGPQSPLPCGRDIIRACPKRGLERY